MKESCLLSRCRRFLVGARLTVLAGGAWLVGGAVPLGCAGSVTMKARSLPGDELPRDGNLSLSLRAILISGSTERPLADNESLHSGDQVYFLVRTNQPAYLYVVLFGPDGAASVLYPAKASREQLVAALCPLRIPAHGSFYLQKPAGVEDLRVSAATVPLARADRRLCEQLQLPCTAESVASEAPPQCPTEAARSFFSIAKVATATPRGVASLRLTLRHDE